MNNSKMILSKKFRFPVSVKNHFEFNQRLLNQELFSVYFVYMTGFLCYNKARRLYVWILFLTNLIFFNLIFTKSGKGVLR